MCEEYIKYLTVQMTEYEYCRIIKMIDQWNRHRDLCRTKYYEPKNGRIKDKSIEITYPKILNETTTRRLKLPQTIV